VAVAVGVEVEVPDDDCVVVPDSDAVDECELVAVGVGDSEPDAL